jgi:hypothetical protein
VHYGVAVPAAGDAALGQQALPTGVKEMQTISRTKPNTPRYLRKLELAMIKGNVHQRLVLANTAASSHDMTLKKR